MMSEREELLMLKELLKDKIINKNKNRVITK